MQSDTIMELFDESSRHRPFSGNEEYLTYLIAAFELALYDFLANHQPAESNPYGSQRLLVLSHLESRLGQRTSDILQLKGTVSERTALVRDYITSRTLRTENLLFRTVCNRMQLEPFSVFCLIGAVYLFFEPDSQALTEVVCGKDCTGFTIEAMSRVYQCHEFSPVKSYSAMRRAVQSLLPLLHVCHPELVGSASIMADRVLIDHLLAGDTPNSLLCEAGEYFRSDFVLPELYANADAVDAIVDAASQSHPFAVITGRVCSGKRFTLRCAAQRLGICGYILDARRFFSADSELRRSLVWQLCREAKLGRIFCMLTNIDELSKEVDTGEVSGALLSLGDSLSLLCLSSDNENYVYENDGTFFAHIHIAVPDASLRYELFRSFAAKTPYAAEVPLHEFANKYRFTVGQIKQAVENASLLAIQDTGSITSAVLQQSCSSLVNNGLGSRATLIHTPFDLDDVILPPAQKKQLLFACGQIRNQHIVYDSWGYGSRVTYGKGTSMLLYGPPGTGKTMTASAVANRLGLELYRVDISKIVDKYIGETEKNIGEIFDRAKQCSVVLFFDEADALFSKRSEVGSSNDRHANMETGFLLQCVEDYDGISILATNYKQNIDPAFLRRIKFTVEFPAPQADIRHTLWQKSFPKESPLDPAVDFDFLAEHFELSGGNIKNISVNAAFYAAEHGSKIDMEAIINCVYAELQKNHMVTDSSCFAQYSTLLRLS